MRKQKQASRDFGVEQLPHNRKEVFADCFKVQFPTLLKLGGILLLFALPLIFAYIFNQIALEAVYLEYGEEEFGAYQFVGQLTLNLINIPCFAIFAVGLSGVMYVIRQLAWGENLFFRQDFWHGVKLNWKTYVLWFVLFGIIRMLNTFISATLGGVAQGFVSALPLGVLWMIIVPAGLWMMCLTVVYDIKFTKNFYNGFCLYCKTFLVSLLALAGVAVVPVLLAFVGYIFINLIVFVLYLLALPIGLLGWFLYCNSVFDTYINATEYPQIVGKGIYKLDQSQTEEPKTDSVVSIFDTPQDEPEDLGEIK